MANEHLQLLSISLIGSSEVRVRVDDRRAGREVCADFPRADLLPDHVSGYVIQRMAEWMVSEDRTKEAHAAIEAAEQARADADAAERKRVIAVSEAARVKEESEAIATAARAEAQSVIDAANKAASDVETELASRLATMRAEVAALDHELTTKTEAIARVDSHEAK